MTVSQRNALARTWIEEGNNNTSSLNQLPPAAEAGEGGDNDSSSSNDGNDEPQKDVLETWMIMVGGMHKHCVVSRQYGQPAVQCAGSATGVLSAGFSVCTRVLACKQQGVI